MFAWIPSKAIQKAFAPRIQQVAIGCLRHEMPGVPRVTGGGGGANHRPPSRNPRAAHSPCWWPPGRTIALGEEKAERLGQKSGSPTSLFRRKGTPGQNALPTAWHKGSGTHSLPIECWPEKSPIWFATKMATQKVFRSMNSESDWKILKKAEA